MPEGVEKLGDVSGDKDIEETTEDDEIVRDVIMGGLTVVDGMIVLLPTLLEDRLLLLLFP